MKKFIITLPAIFMICMSSLMAETSVKLEGVHLCCKACVRGVEKAITTVEGASVVADRDAGTAVVTAPDKKTLRKGLNAIAQGGFYGVSKDSSMKVRDISGAKNKQVKKVTIKGVHLCCNGCVYAVEDALDTVKGVTGNTLEKKVESFEVTGDFNEKELFAALNKAGFAGRASR